MKFSLRNFRLNIFKTTHKPGTFPISAEGDYSAITKITRKQLHSWPPKYLQFYMDYCLAKEIYEVAALVRDVAFIRRIRIEIHNSY